MAHQLVGKRILIIEDEHLIALDIAYEIADRGAKVIGPVATVDAALTTIAKTNNLDGVILDLNLMDKMAFEVAEILATRNSNYAVPRQLVGFVCCCAMTRSGRPAAPPCPAMNFRRLV